MALRLYGITPADAHHGGPEGNGEGSATTLVPFRDLCAVVSEQSGFALDEPTPADLARHREIVDALFRRTAVLPAPIGVVFRAPDVLKRWMELHYVSLTGALEFVEDRVAARVHTRRADGKQEEADSGSDLAAAAAEVFRALRRHAVASVPLHLEHTTGVVLSASFLVERDLWKEFEGAVAEQHDAHRHLRFELTGPWAPYDFVRMQFGG